MDFQEKLERLDEENIHPSERFSAQIMLVVQNGLVNLRDNERFEDWSYAKIVSKCNKSGEYYTKEEHLKVVRDAQREARKRKEFFANLDSPDI